MEGDAEAGAGEIRYSREMGVTHADFFRILPKAMGAHPYRVDGLTVRGELGGGSIEITVGPERERRIALLALPYAEVSFTFQGVAPETRESFRRHFELYFQRGGG